MINDLINEYNIIKRKKCLTTRIYTKQRKQRMMNLFVAFRYRKMN